LRESGFGRDTAAESKSGSGKKGLTSGAGSGKLSEFASHGELDESAEGPGKRLKKALDSEREM